MINWVYTVYLHKHDMSDKLSWKFKIPINLRPFCAWNLLYLSLPGYFALLGNQQLGSQNLRISNDPEWFPSRSHLVMFTVVFTMVLLSSLFIQRESDDFLPVASKDSPANQERCGKPPRCPKKHDLETLDYMYRFTYAHIYI